MKKRRVSTYTKPLNGRKNGMKIYQREKCEDRLNQRKILSGWVVRARRGIAQGRKTGRREKRERHRSKKEKAKYHDERTQKYSEIRSPRKKPNTTLNRPGHAKSRLCRMLTGVGERMTERGEERRRETGRITVVNVTPRKEGFLERSTKRHQKTHIVDRAKEKKKDRRKPRNIHCSGRSGPNRERENKCFRPKAEGKEKNHTLKP